MQGGATQRGTPGYNGTLGYTNRVVHQILVPLRDKTHFFKMANDFWIPKLRNNWETELIEKSQQPKAQYGS